MKERLVLYQEQGVSETVARHTGLCAFATLDRNGLPAVRIIDVMLKEEGVSFFVRHVARISVRSFWRILPLL